MKLYRLIVIDLNSKSSADVSFFKTFEDAVDALRYETFGIFYNRYTDMYTIYNGAVASATISDNSLYMRGYDEEFGVSVEVNIDEFEIKTNDNDSTHVYELRRYQGHTDWMLSFTEKEPETIKYFTNKKRARKYAKRFTYISRAWNQREFDRKSNVCMGGSGNDYFEIIVHEIK